MLSIEDTPVGDGNKPYIIAEIGINARNDLTLAKRFIEVAADSGADAVKFQTHVADAEMVESEMRRIGAGDVYDTIAGCEWSVDEHRELRLCAEENDVAFLSTPFSTDAVRVLEKIGVPAIKIGSGEMSNRELVEEAARTEKPLLVSTGMNELEDISETCEFLESVASDYALFYCVSEYPTNPEDFDFRTIATLKDLSGSPVGFSDHSTGVEAAKVAIGNGADLIEKHFTIDRRLPGPDQPVSVEPAELSELCSFAELYYETSSEKQGLRDEEVEIKRWAQHSVVATERIKKGTELSRENTTTKRPETGISAENYLDMIGKEATQEIPAGTIIEQDDIESSS